MLFLLLLSGVEVTPNITPFAHSGTWEALMKNSLGALDGWDRECPGGCSCPIPREELNHRCKKLIRVNIKGNRVQWLERLAQEDCIDRRVPALFILAHTDGGFPSLVLSRDQQPQQNDLADTFKSKYPLWYVWTVNFDDWYSKMSPNVRGIPLGLTNGIWIRDELKTLCRVVSDSITHPNQPTKWLLVAIGTGSNQHERGAAIEAARKVSASAPPNSVTFTNTNHEAYLRAMSEVSKIRIGLFCVSLPFMIAFLVSAVTVYSSLCAVFFACVLLLSASICAGSCRSWMGHTQNVTCVDDGLNTYRSMDSFCLHF